MDPNRLGRIRIWILVLTFIRIQIWRRSRTGFENFRIWIRSFYFIFLKSKPLQKKKKKLALNIFLINECKSQFVCTYVQNSFVKA